MNYISTRGQAAPVSPSRAILNGIAPDGGLYVPETIPVIPPEDMRDMLNMDHAERCAAVLSLFLTDFTKEELLAFCREAYHPSRFESVDTAPLVRLSDESYILELFHGPSCAFKDFALQLLPRLLSRSITLNGLREKLIILTATSGDTGKAALEGFRDVPQTGICVFYPHGGVSEMQRLQMVTTGGNNTYVCAVNGNFDDAQTQVKAVFGDAEYNKKLRDEGYALSSANSINWGRLCPQIAYYFTAYCDLVDQYGLPLGQEVDFCVPTGNFGDILAGWYARECGLPVRRLICASNTNNVLTDFFDKGVYDRNRPFFRTASPSMDILVSSNLERLLYLVSGSAGKTREYMERLKSDGAYGIGQNEWEAIRRVFCACYADDGMTLREIRRIYDKYGYVCDTHTAVALCASEKMMTRDVPIVTLSTASPFKFSSAVLRAITCSVPDTEPDALAALSRLTGMPVPSPLASSLTRQVRFTDVADKDGLREKIDSFRRRL